jgi:2'-5' RNA ligase
MRLFIGIPLADTVVAELSGLTKRLKAPGDGLRWPAAAGWHITLQFLGKTSEEQYRCVAARLGEISQGPFAIQLEPPGFFDRAGVFFAGVGLSSQLERLQQRVVEGTQPCGFAAEDRPYHPHITLARVKSGRAQLSALKSRVRVVPAFSSFVAREFLLYESFPDAGGSRYEVRERFILAG